MDPAGVTSDIASRMLRLFASTLLPWNDISALQYHDKINSTYLMISDADIWPIDYSWFHFNLSR